MRKSLLAILLSFVVGGLTMPGSVQADDGVAVHVKANPASPLNHAMKTLDGKPVNPAEKYAGKVVLLVNVASKCGLTPQYEQLQGLFEKYGAEGLVVVGVPCNQFNGQEPGTSEEIATFCSSKYNVTFDLLEKSDVNGPDACAIYQALTSKETNPASPGPIQWNFEKFLFNRQGELVARFAPRTAPNAPEVVTAIEAELAKR